MDKIHSLSINQNLRIWYLGQDSCYLLAFSINPALLCVSLFCDVFWKSFGSKSSFKTFTVSVLGLACCICLNSFVLNHITTQQIWGQVVFHQWYSKFQRGLIGAMFLSILAMRQSVYIVATLSNRGDKSQNAFKGSAKVNVRLI